MPSGALAPSSFSPLATILELPSGRGRRNFSASIVPPSSHTSTSSGAVRITGIAFGWIGATIALAPVVKNPNSSCVASTGALAHRHHAGGVGLRSGMNSRTLRTLSSYGVWLWRRRPVPFVPALLRI